MTATAMRCGSSVTTGFLVVTGPTEPAALGTVAATVTVGVTYTLPSPGEPCNVSFNWLAGTSQTVLNDSGSASASHQYAATGVYTVGISVKDTDGNEAARPFQYVVIYDPSGGFVTGGGWIESPAGAYSRDLTLAGKASFGFVSKYEKGASKPSGNTEFQFKAGDLHFKSSSYEWLVVSGARGQFKGTGSINGQEVCGFLLTAVDGQVTGGGGNDRFRIKIWDKQTDNAVVYDNQMGAEDDAALVEQTIDGGGSIVIHQPPGKK